MRSKNEKPNVALKREITTSFSGAFTLGTFFATTNIGNTDHATSEIETQFEKLNVVESSESKLQKMRDTYQEIKEISSLEIRTRAKYVLLREVATVRPDAVLNSIKKLVQALASRGETAAIREKWSKVFTTIATMNSVESVIDLYEQEMKGIDTTSTIFEKMETDDANLKNEQQSISTIRQSDVVLYKQASPFDIATCTALIKVKLLTLQFEGLRNGESQIVTDLKRVALLVIFGAYLKANEYSPLESQQLNLNQDLQFYLDGFQAIVRLIDGSVSADPELVRDPQMEL